MFKQQVLKQLKFQQLIFQQLWNDQSGAVVSLEIVLAATILGIGVITGLSSLRDAAITELADVAGAVAWLDQSYHLHGVKSHSASTASTWHHDLRDYCDDGTTTTAERCLVICGGTFAGDAGSNESGD